ncbi:hypothetical protein ACIBEA_38990 [Streptomyces sp. NPDC051555]|uniref:hypothetical protein n=1 Tax=Streptomyces sp. NPDC051555 TaxID=3365657 RepID=UPI0037B12545
MFQPGALVLAFILGTAIIFVIVSVRPRRRRPLLPPSVAAASPELIAALSLAVVEQYPDFRRFAYAAVSVWERNSPDATVHLFPARGPRLGSISLDSGGPGTAGGRASQLLSEMKLNSGVMVIPFPHTH